MADPIIDKLRKLFALADESSGAGEHERNAAAAQAAKLMAKYDIDQAEVGSDPDSPASRAGLRVWRSLSRNELWIQMLATSISLGLGSPVEVLGRQRDGKRQCYMIGSEVKVEFVTRLAEYLIPQLKIECEAALLHRKEEYAANGNRPPALAADFADDPDISALIRPKAKPWTGADTRKFRQAFLKTAACEIKDRIESAYQEETDGTGTELVLRSERDDVNAYMAENDIHVRQRKTQISSQEGYRAGKVAAASVDVTPGAKVASGARHQLGAGA